MSKNIHTKGNFIQCCWFKRKIIKKITSLQKTTMWHKSIKQSILISLEKVTYSTGYMGIRQGNLLDQKNNVSLM